jgi:hypothetical protein
MRGSLIRLLAGCAVVAIQACNCSGGESYVIERDVSTGNGNPAGSACTIDADCESGRCQNGVCSTGECDGDDDCRDNEVCVFGECTPDSSFECTADQHPIIDINPAEVDFGAVAVGVSPDGGATGETRSVTIRNLGSCLLTLQGVGFSSTTPPDFRCGANQCDISTFPKRLPPNRAYTVDVTYTPSVPGERTGQLQIRSDDENYPTQMVPLIGRYSGVPRFLVEPEIVDFGFVAPAQTLVKKVRVSNVGDGNAVLRLTDVRMGSAAVTAYTSTPDISFPANVVTLRPTTQGAADCLTTGGCVDIDVTFRPPAYASYSNELLLTYETAAGQPPGSARVLLKGFSTTPPVLNVSETVIDFGDTQVGSTVTPRVVRIENNGQTPMTAQVTISPLSSTDFSVEAPTPFELPVPPGGYALMRVNYDPTVLGTVTGEIRVASNDPTTYNAAFGAGTKTLTVRANGTPNMFNDLLKVEMTFENGDNGFFGNDFRDVDLMLEGPQGDLCTKPTYSVNAQGQITGILEDPCATWTYGGTPRWQAIGAAREPERIILANAGTAQGNYVVKVSYEEDCASIPTQLIAGLLGIGIDALVGYISGGVIDLGSSDIASFIANNCWDHAASTATVTVFINGAANMNCSKRLGSAGLVRDVVTINRNAVGQFTATCVP